MSDDFFSGGLKSSSQPVASTSIPAAASKGTAAVVASSSQNRISVCPGKAVDLIKDLNGLHDVDVSSHEQLYREEEGMEVPHSIWHQHFSTLSHVRRAFLEDLIDGKLNT
jgi:hypothetical protein